MIASKWIDDLVNSVGCFMNLETTDGVERCGKITGYTFREFKLNDNLVQIPIEVEVNGDPIDRIPLDRILFMKIQKAK